jgi:hypothetical protein
MIKEILTAAGVEFAQGRFLRMPAGTHAVYFDDIEVETADRVPSAAMPRVYHHNVTVEVYEPAPDDNTERAIEAALDARGIPWSKQDRYWLKDPQRYQTVYGFAYTVKSK